MAEVIYAGDAGLFKICTLCGEAKQPAAFYKSRDGALGVKAFCAACARDEARDYHHSNRGAVLARQRERRAVGADEARAYAREWAAKNRAKRKAYFAKWVDRHPEKYRASRDRSGQRQRATTKGRLEASIRTAVNRSLSCEKAGRTFALLGYTVEILKAHLERQFARGMSWANYGEWHVDHIVPLSSFTYQTPDDPEFRAAWALTNLRPLWGAENIAKGAGRLTLL